MPSTIPIVLSGSTDGDGILVTGTTTGTAVVVHTADADDEDDVWVFAWNSHTADVELTIEWGSQTGQPMKLPIPFNDGVVAVIPGWRLSGAKTVKAFAAVANVVKLAGNVMRYSAT